MPAFPSAQQGVGSSRKGVWKSEPHPCCKASSHSGKEHPELSWDGTSHPILCKFSGSFTETSWEKSLLSLHSGCGSAVLAQHGHGARRAAPKAFPSGALAQPMLMRKGVIQRSFIRAFYFKLALRLSLRDAP